MKDLPPPVQKAVQEQIKTAKSRDILMDASGAIVEVEEATAFDSLPEAARKALRTNAGSGKILRVKVRR